MLFLLNDHNLNEYNEYAVKKKIEVSPRQIPRYS